MKAGDVPFILMTKALEFNASVIAYCTPFIGNTKDKATIKSFTKGYKDMSAHYQTVVREILENMDVPPEEEHANK